MSSLEKKLIFQEQTEQCRQPAEDAGECDNWVIRYSFIASDKSCKAYYYGGCGGNDNRFESIEECESKCSSAPPVVDSRGNFEIIFLLVAGYFIHRHKNIFKNKFSPFRHKLFSTFFTTHFF